MEPSRPIIRLVFLMLLILFTLVVACVLAHKESFMVVQDAPIYVINLEHRKDRKARMEQQIQTDKVIFIKAVHGAQVDDVVHKRLHNNILTKGQGGCALSHLLIYQEMIDKDIPHAIIFEDDNDIKLPDDYDKIQRLVDAVPDEWNLIFLATNNGGIDVGNEIYEMTQPQVLGSHGYVIKKELAAQFLDHVRNNTINEPFDFVLSNKQRLPSMHAYKAKENIIHLVSGDSDTQGIQ